MPSLDLRVYVITDRSFGPEGWFWDNLEAVLDAGTTCLQIREKGSARELYDVSRKILPLARKRGIPLIINDRLDVAMAVDADGVHLGTSDLDAASARRLWGPHKWIGVSAATDEALLEAEPSGADYVGIGALFPTTTKNDAVVIGADELTRLTGLTPLASVGIGGITLDNAAQVFQNGCRGVAVVSAIWAAANPADAVRALRQIAEWELE